jgi:hypothetical protein
MTRAIFRGSLCGSIEYIAIAGEQQASPPPSQGLEISSILAERRAFPPDAKKLRQRRSTVACEKEIRSAAHVVEGDYSVRYGTRLETVTPYMMQQGFRFCGTPHL